MARFRSVRTAAHSVAETPKGRLRPNMAFQASTAAGLGVRLNLQTLLAASRAFLRRFNSADA